MNDLDLATLAREAREQVNPGPPPLDAITAPPARHPGRWLLLAAAAVVVAVLVSVLVPHHDKPAPSGPVVVPTPPIGAQWVGAGQVVLAVPVSWAESQYGCEREPRPAVVYDVDYWTNCQASPLGRQGRPAALWVAPRTDTYADGFGARRATIAVPEVSGWRSKPWWAEGDAGGYWYEALQTNDAVFVAQGTTRAEVSVVIDSARRLPAGVVVPPSTAGQNLDEALRTLGGYDVLVSRIASPFREGSVFSSQPGFGTPQAPGAPITLMVSRGLGHSPVFSDKELLRQHLRVEPAGSFPQGVGTRIAATQRDIRLDLAAHLSPWDRQLLLRRVTDTSHSGPINGRLTWMVLEPGALTQSSQGGCCGADAPRGVVRKITLYDAQTGRLLGTRVFR